MEDKEKKTDFFDATRDTQGEIVCGVAMVAAVGIAVSGFGAELFSGPATFANISEIVIALAVILIGSSILFLLGATIYVNVLNRLSFLKYPFLKGVALTALMGLVAYILQSWIAK